jgi:hypothetical protein
MILEVVEAGWDQTTIDYDVQYDINEYSGAKKKAIQSFIWESYGSLAFGAVEGEKTYEGWSRCTINISGPVCIRDECKNGDPFLDPKDEEDMATQLCWDCRNPEDDEEEEE